VLQYGLPAAPTTRTRVPREQRRGSQYAVYIHYSLCMRESYI
jgi:hypothetical protein